MFSKNMEATKSKCSIISFEWELKKSMVLHNLSLKDWKPEYRKLLLIYISVERYNIFLKLLVEFTNDQVLEKIMLSGWN